MSKLKQHMVLCPLDERVWLLILPPELTAEQCAAATDALQVEARVGVPFTLGTEGGTAVVLRLGARESQDLAIVLQSAFPDHHLAKASTLSGLPDLGFLDHDFLECMLAAVLELGLGPAGLSGSLRFAEELVRLLTDLGRVGPGSTGCYFADGQCFVFSLRGLQVSPDSAVIFATGSATVRLRGQKFVTETGLTRSSEWLVYADARSGMEDMQHLVCCSDARLILMPISIEAFETVSDFAGAQSARTDIVSLVLTSAAGARSRYAAPSAGATRLPQRIELADGSLIFSPETMLCMEHGVFLAGWYLDPYHQIATVHVADSTLSSCSVSAHWHVYDHSVDINGKTEPDKRFAVFLPRSDRCLPLLAPVIALRSVSGDVRLCRPDIRSTRPEGQRHLIMETIKEHALSAEAVRQCYAPAIAPLQASIHARQSVRKIKDHGLRGTAEISLIIPIYRQLGFLRSQLFAFYSDSYIRDNCQIVLVLDDPLLADQLDFLVFGFVTLMPLDIRIVTLEKNGGYALANNLGVDACSGDEIVLLNSDVVPKQPGWLQLMQQRLAHMPQYSVIGPKLLYGDDTLQHAGMYFLPLTSQYWQNMHYFKGYAPNFPPASVGRTVPAVTGACMLLKKTDFTEVGGFTTDYVIGDYEDSDLCLKLRQQGGTAFYEPAAELYHFERQSMKVSTARSDNTTTAYNRALHTLRWDATIRSLMARQEADNAAE